MDIFEKLRQETLVQIKEMEEREIAAKTEPKSHFIRWVEEKQRKQKEYESNIIERKHPYEELWITDQIYLLRDEEEQSYKEWRNINRDYLEESKLSPTKQRFLHYLINS
ncbi:hypothetical protein [Bacillus pseudomycoides]|uniref:hypothetical protein n=1 Tax=Bacillus pseudomycoides TaxID=64104 RepID=UPI000BEF7A56|nr:hypothetical protein [Bacillus pseudomycoides]PEK31563.1 hypothetical protein CN691_17610 [Bacillus pseudomycoides]